MTALREWRQDMLFMMLVILLAHVQGFSVQLAPGVLWVLIFQMVMMGRSLSLLTLIVSGLYLDILWAQPVGLSVVLMLAVSALAFAVRGILYEKPFEVFWLACAVVTGGTFLISALMQWVMLGLLSLSWGGSVVLGVVCYPLMVKILMAVLYSKRGHGTL